MGIDYCEAFSPDTKKAYWIVQRLSSKLDYLEAMLKKAPDRIDDIDSYLDELEEVRKALFAATMDYWKKRRSTPDPLCQ